VSLHDDHTMQCNEEEQLILAKQRRKHEVAKEECEIALYERQLAMDTACDCAEAWVQYEKWAELTNPLLRLRQRDWDRSLAAKKAFVFQNRS